MSLNRGHLSEQGIQQLKTEESFKPNVYNDQGRDAIGYGVNLKWFPEIRKRCEGKTPITKAQGLDILREVLPEYEREGHP